MYKKLLHQIRNEWRSNLWLGAELLLVSVVLWFVVDFIYVNLSIYFQPQGFDITHCYKIDTDQLSKDNEHYIPSDTLYPKQFDEMVRRLRLRPDIEWVCLSNTAVPYIESKVFNTLENQSQHISYMILQRAVTPDFIRVFRIQGARGETPETLARIFQADPNGFLASENCLLQTNHVKMSALIGTPFYVGGIGGDTTAVHRLIATYLPMRQNDHSDVNSQDGTSHIIHLNKDEYGSTTNISVRVKADKDINFANRLWRDADKDFRVGNMFISNISSFDDLRTVANKEGNKELSFYLVGASFLLLNIFLGLLGTFWFRTQQRRSEIALFKALGATNAHCFGRIIVEGLLILTITTLPALIIDLNIAYASLTPYLGMERMNASRFVSCTAITWLLIALMIVLGSWMPARKAMKIQPAEALHGE